MISTRCKCLIMAMLVAAVGSTAFAQPLPLDSSTFLYQYEMDVQPSSLDLDMNGTADWFPGEAGGLIEPQVMGGIASSDHSVTPVEGLFRTDYGGSLTRNALVKEGMDDNYRLEVSIALDPLSLPGDVGVAGIAVQLPDDGTGLRMNIGVDNVSFNFEGIDPIATPDNSDGFHKFQIYRSAPNEYWIWRDDVLLNPGDAPIGGSNFFNGNGAFFVGDFSSSLGGEFQVDYIRLQPEPVPEPAAAFALLLGMAGLVASRRGR